MAGKAKHTFATGFSMLLMVIALTSNGWSKVDWAKVGYIYDRNTLYLGLMNFDQFQSLIDPTGEETMIRTDNQKIEDVMCDAATAERFVTQSTEESIKDQLEQNSQGCNNYGVANSLCLFLGIFATLAMFLTLILFWKKPKSKGLHLFTTAIAGGAMDAILVSYIIFRPDYVPRTFQAPNAVFYSYFLCAAAAFLLQASAINWVCQAEADDSKAPRLPTTLGGEARRAKEVALEQLPIVLFVIGLFFFPCAMYNMCKYYGSDNGFNKHWAKASAAMLIVEMIYFVVVIAFYNMLEGVEAEAVTTP